MTSTRSLVITVLILFVLVGDAIGLPTSTQSDTATFVEPSLWSKAVENLSLIVTADSSQTAAQIVESLGGQVSSDLWLIDAVAVTLPGEQLGWLAGAPGVRSIVENKGVKSAQAPWDGWVTDYSFPVPWDGSPDAQPTGNPVVWDLVNPTSIDVGADILHNEHGLTGQGLAVAVVDSGVYFSPHIKSALGPQIGQLFQGQADFVADGICPGPGTQYSDHCFTNSAQTYDGHGHGSHVAGLIWNNFTDLDTGVYQGIAPGTNILSVRVLGTDGTGRYADVVEGIQYVVANKEAYNIRVMNISLSAYVTTPYFEDPLNRAVEQAWASGIVVVAPAGNIGPDAESITVLDDNNKLDR